LSAKLAGATEIGFMKQFQMGRRRFGFVDLLGQVESLLETAFPDRLFRPALYDRPGRGGLRGVFFLCQGAHSLSADFRSPFLYHYI
jgi:hypothetical protein